MKEEISRRTHRVSRQKDYCLQLLISTQERMRQNKSLKEKGVLSCGKTGTTLWRPCFHTPMLTHMFFFFFSYKIYVKKNKKKCVEKRRRRISGFGPCRRLCHLEAKEHTKVEGLHFFFFFYIYSFFFYSFIYSFYFFLYILNLIPHTLYFLHSI